MDEIIRIALGTPLLNLTTLEKTERQADVRRFQRGLVHQLPFRAPGGETLFPDAWSHLRLIKILRQFDFGTGLPKASIQHWKDTLYVAYYASAEMGCHLTLNWPLPENLLDLFEFRVHMNRLRPQGWLRSPWGDVLLRTGSHGPFC